MRDNGRFPSPERATVPDAAALYAELLKQFRFGESFTAFQIVQRVPGTTPGLIEQLAASGKITDTGEGKYLLTPPTNPEGPVGGKPFNPYTVEE